MRPPGNEWPNTDNARHVLFLAQSFREILDRNTFESFRVQTLDLQARLAELLRLIDQFQKKEVRSAALSAPAQELLSSIEIDPVAAEICPVEISEYQIILRRFSKSGDAKIAKIKQYTEYIHSHLESRYKTSLELKILSLSQNQGSKEDLRRLIQAYCSHIINIGYSRSYVFNVAQAIFFKDDIKVADQRLIKRFFKNFDQKRSKYEVAIPVRKGTIGFLHSLKIERFKPIARENLAKHFRNAIDSSNNISPKDRFLLVENSGIDPYRAAETARQMLRILSSVTVLEDRGVVLLSSHLGFVAEKGKRTVTQVKAESTRLQPLKTFTTISQGKRVKTYATSLIGDFPSDSAERVLSAVESASLARFSENSENQLTLVWSAIEVLFGNPHDEDTSRISYYQDCLAPCLCLNYAWRHCRAVFVDLTSHHRKALESALDEAGVSNDFAPLERFQRFIFLPEFSEHHKRFFERISSNPLAMNRVFRLFKKFESPSSYLQSVNDHELRVRWQIARIYRARNEFIHAGMRHSYIDSLSLNAFEYFRTALHALIYRSKEERFQRDISYFLAGIEISYSARKAELAKHDPTDREGFMRFFSRA